LIVLVEPELAPVPVTPFKFRVQVYVVPVVALFSVMFRTPLLQIFCTVGSGVNLGVGLTVRLTVSTFVQPFAVRLMTYFTIVGAEDVLVNRSPMVSLFDKALGAGVMFAFATRIQENVAPKVAVVALYLNVSPEQICVGVFVLDRLGVGIIVAVTVSCSLHEFAVNV
jgi:hypothetical protein